MDVIVSASPVDPKKAEKKGPDEWEIQSWARTIIEAEEIKADPKKMKLVAPHLKAKVKGLQGAIKSIADLKTVAAAKAAEESDTATEGDDE